MYARYVLEISHICYIKEQIKHKVHNQRQSKRIRDCSSKSIYNKRRSTRSTSRGLSRDIRNMRSSIVKKLLCCGAKSFPSESSSDDAVPEGHVRVNVGKDIVCKFEMEANYLNHPLFENLLRLSEEEFGYSYDGALRIVCDIDLFQYLLHLLKTSNPSAHYMELPDLISKFYSSNATHLPADQ